MLKIKLGKKDVGEVGVRTGLSDFAGVEIYVGDMLEVSKSKRIVCQDETGEFRLMGWFSQPLSHVINTHAPRVVGSYDKLVAGQIIDSSVTIVSVSVEEMREQILELRGKMAEMEREHSSVKHKEQALVGALAAKGFALVVE